MKKAKLYISLLIMSLLVLTQVWGVSAAAAHDNTDTILGSIQEITLETDLSTGVTTVLVTLRDENKDVLTVRISEQTAYDLGLLDYDVDGNPFIVQPLPETIEIDPATILPDEDDAQHPIGSAIATFFSDVPGVEYSTIMEAYENGTGFGVIAQALWLTRKLGGDADAFMIIIEAKKTGDFSTITLSDGTTPLNWGQFKKAVLAEDKKGNLGMVISDKEKDNGNGNPGNHGNNSNNVNNKDKEKEKDNGNGNPGNHGNNSNNGNGNPNRP
ncbi:MAG TPA: hypothetical protein VFY26_00175 [Anaerolineales bacterium]|nr:hypothetical protein [Anaerolineales bacterium]